MWYAFIDSQRRLTRAYAGAYVGAYVRTDAGNHGSSDADACAGKAAAEPGSPPSTPFPWLTPQHAFDAFRHWLLRSTCAFETPPAFAIDSVDVDGCRVAVEERAVVSLPVGTLLRFSRKPDPPACASKPPVLLCAPLAGHHAVMLRETVETLLQERDVFVTDWANARDVPLAAGKLSLDDYVLAIEHFLDAAHAQGAPVHVVAVCQGTVPALAAAALLASERRRPFASVALLGGPIDCRLNPTAVGRFANAHSLAWFRDNAIDVVPPPYPGAGRRVYPGFIQHAAIIAAHPERHARIESAYWSSWISGDMTGAMRALRSLNEYAAVLDMEEAYFLDMLRVVFHEHLLPRNEWRVAGRLVRTAALRGTPLCTIEGDCDDITGTGQTHCAHALCDALPVRPERQITVERCNHYDVFTGARWRDAVYPALRSFWSEVESAARRPRAKRRAARVPETQRQADVTR